MKVLVACEESPRYRQMGYDEAALDKRIKYEEDAVKIWENAGKCVCCFQTQQEEHKQLLAWLTELRRLREQVNNERRQTMSDKLIRYKERNHDDPFDYELDDLILRRDAMEAVENEDNLHGAMDSVWDGAFRRTKRAAVRVIAGVSAVKQPMSAVEYERISRRFSDWCASTLCAECSFFDDCPQTSPDVLRELTPEQYVAAIQKWAREHPERNEDDGKQE